MSALSRLGLILLFALMITKANNSFAQSNSKVRAGIELDVLPYATGGYFGAVCAGNDRWRMRILTANVNKPDWSTKKGFNSHNIHAYAMVVDYFPGSGWRKWWIGAGPVLWKSKIKADGSDNNSVFSNFLLNGSLGYNLGLGKHFYLSPWMGLSLNVAGDKDIMVGNKVYNLPLLNPEASLKIGAHF